MFEIESNKKAWGLLSYDHYLHFKKALSEKSFQINPIIQKEIGDVKGKRILHLQCNTGADSILLARMGAIVTGVDLAPENIHYAKELCKDFNISNAEFIESDILALMDKHDGEYDIVFTSDGAIGWLPDLKRWATTVKHFLRPDGYFFVHDSHPFYLVFDEEDIRKGQTTIKYPYFKKTPDVENYIGGYASERKESTNYFWSYKISDVINALSSADLFIKYFKEYDRAAEGMGGSSIDEEGLSYIPDLEGKIPLSFSLKAVHR